MERDSILRLQGRDLSPADLLELQLWVAAHPDWSRNRLRLELCLRWQWRNARGALKTFAAASLLSKLEQRGCLQLPPIRIALRRLRPWSIAARVAEEILPDPPQINIPLRLARPVLLEPLAAGSQHERRAEAQLARWHYRGLDRPVGAHLYYRALDSQGRELAVFLLGAAAWRCSARDRWIGWDDHQRRARLELIANQARFLILPGVQVPLLASHLLSLLRRRVAADWFHRHGRRLLAIESFVEMERFSGTCYRAANWLPVGLTRGRSRQDRHHRMQVGIKQVFLLGLQPGFEHQLRKPLPTLPATDPPVPAASVA